MMKRIALGLGLTIAGTCGTFLGPVDNSTSALESSNVEVIYQFPPTMAPENEYLRSNGQLLVTCLTCNVLSQLDPNLGPAQTRRSVFTFPDGVINVLGIDELQEDVFAVAVGQVDLKDAAQINSTQVTSLIQGPTGVWIVDLREYQAPKFDSTKVKAHKVGGKNTGGLFDGVAVINADRGLVALTDFVEGNIWLTDIRHGTTSILVEQPILPASNGEPSSFLLANGLKLKDSKLYFTASVTGTYGYVPLDLDTGRPTGPVQVVYNYGFSVDDFNFGPSGTAYFTTFAKPNGGVLKRAAGTANGASGTTMPVSYFATNSIIPRDVEGNACELIMTAFLRFQVVKATIPGPC